MADFEDDAKPKSGRIGASPASNDWDPGPVADQKLINALKSRTVDPSYHEDDPLLAKHKAKAFRDDFRTVDYKQLSKGEDERTAARRRTEVFRSSWAPNSRPEKSERPSSRAKFASFGGSTISAEIIRRETGVRPSNGDDETSPDSEPRSALDMPLPDAAGQQSPKAQFDDAQLSGDLEVGEEPLLLEAPRENASPDALTEIDGIGPSLERLLYDLGIFHFEQIAGWTQPHVAWIEHALSCEQGRVAKEEWVRQAIELKAR